MMSRPIPKNDPFFTNEELEQYRRCYTTRQTLMLLATRKTPLIYKRKHHQRNCLQWLRQWRQLSSDDSSLVHVVHDVITQHIFPRIPTDFPEDCKFHDYRCFCTAKMKENFVLRKLIELGVDVHQIRAQIDAALIMTMENNSTNLANDGRPIIQATKRTAPHLPRNQNISSAQKLSQLALRIGNLRSQFVAFRETHDRVIVEYLPNTPQNFRSVLKTRTNKRVIRHFTDEGV